jgi:hypothetical protein
MYLYEKVEEMEVENFMKKSPKKRDLYLYHTPQDEITCYFFFMEPREFLECFSNEMIGATFKRLPSDDLFVWCDYIKYTDLIIEKKTFLNKWYTMNPIHLVDNMYYSSETVFSLVDKNVITLPELYIPFEEMDISLLSKLHSQHPYFYKLFKPIRTLIHKVYRFLPYEVVELMISFLFVRYKNEIS